MEIRYPIARIFGNAGIFFVTPYIGSAMEGTPSFGIALWTMLIGLIISASREAVEFGKIKRGF